MSTSNALNINENSFLYLLNCNLGATKGKIPFKEHRSDTTTWRDLKKELEIKLLGRSMEADYILEKELRHMRKSTKKAATNDRPHKQELKAKVVGTSLDQDSYDAAQIRERSQALPWLHKRAILQPGDILLVWRFPRFHDTVEQIYNKKRALAANDVENVPRQFEKFLRLELAEKEIVPQLYGDHRWTADKDAKDGLRMQQRHASVEFTKEMTEADRIALLTDAAANEYGVSAEEQEFAFRKPGKVFHQTNASYQQQQYNTRSAFPPQGYVCKRCNIEGHWIHDCPTKNDARFDPRNILSTNGIARTRLKRVDIDQLAEDYDGAIYRDQQGRFYVTQTNAAQNDKKRKLKATVLLNNL